MTLERHRYVESKEAIQERGKKTKPENILTVLQSKTNRLASKQVSTYENKQVCIMRFECGINKIEYNIIFELVIIIIIIGQNGKALNFFLLLLNTSHLFLRIFFSSSLV